MKNAIVLGAGRSGTSLLAGLFHESGYFSGEKMWRATPSNPLGYFEDIEINKINEDLLDKVAPWRPRGIAGALMPVFRDRPRYSQRWLASLPVGAVIPSDNKLERRMAAQTRRQPYLFKDPRFSYTLTTWAPHISDDTVFICVFRDPRGTVNSIMQIIKTERYLRDLKFTPEMGYSYWRATYESILMLSNLIPGNWLFVHYDEVLSGRALPLLEGNLGAHADPAMVQPELRRSPTEGECESSVDVVYHKLLALSEEKYMDISGWARDESPCVFGIDNAR